MHGLSQESRRVFSVWRVLLIMRDMTISLPEHRRRWRTFPFTVSEIRPLLRELRRAGMITPIERTNQLFEVTAPFADARPLHEFEILAEAYPYSYISGASAMFFYGMTWETSNRLFVTSPASSALRPLPVGTTQDEWVDVALPAEIKLRKIRTQQIDIRHTRNFDLLGVVETRDVGPPIRIATRERTLVEGLNDPERFGGIEQVLLAWYSTFPSVDAQRAAMIAERLGTTLLKQRVGYVMSALGLQAPQFSRWQQEANRGSSSKLDAGSPFSSRYSEEWKLSLNGPVDVLSEQGM